MAVELSVLQNSDDALLVWSVPEAIDDCVGFAVRRELTRDGKTTASWLDNYVGFVGEKHAEGECRPSTEWPFQGFTWTDHGLDSGDSARYRVVPVLRDPDGHLHRADGRRSEWAEGRKASSTYLPYFNRGDVMSQFIAHYLKQTGQSLAQFKDTISDEDDHTIRQFLAGDVRVQLLALLAETRERGGELYAALYELSDPELIDALVALGPRAHVVLANGSISQHKGEPLTTARKRDQNKGSRARLIAGAVDVEEPNRFISPGALAHNKFAVFTDAAGKAKYAWTGSTNWSPTGLCTQLNNALLVRDKDVAAAYLEQWKRLRKAGSEFPKSLVNANSKPSEPRPKATLWFSRTSGQVDLDALGEIVGEAESGLLFLMFKPGAKGALKYVRRRQKEDPDLFVRGVVSELPSAEDETKVDVSFFGAGPPEEHRLEVIQPEGRPQPIAWWAAEATRRQFTGNIGFAIVHSKVLVIDPFSSKATVVTGSHNFSESASDENDENFLVVRGDRALAEAYVVNVFSAWRHYRARVASGNPFAGLKQDGSWMPGSLWARRQDAGFWGF
ncbi:MAG TPA: phospholipase D-like domain-containing protein [Solirubrobacterales bacterium]|nr:phospholipase D-like domain-containing protein [Solirubrobacterales bacterium]